MKSKELYKYLALSVKNEVVVNDYFMSVLGSTNLKISFPGVSKFNNLGLNNRLAKILLRIVYHLWPFIFSPAVNIFYFIKCLRFKLNSRKCLGVSLPNELVFASGQTTLSVITKAVGESEAVLYRPRQKIGGEDNYFDSLQLLSVFDLFQTLCYSIYFSIRYSYDSKTKVNRAYSVFFFDLIAVAKVFDKFGGLEKVYTGDHFDRWAIMLDLIAADKRKIKHLALVQHGSLKNSEGVFPLKLAVKLKSVQTLYCFDKESCDLFGEHIMQNKRCYSVDYFKNSIQLTDMGQIECTRVLIVGHFLCLSFHIELSKYISDVCSEKIQLFYKPHPTQEINGLENENWLTVTDSTIFPNVDFVISYPSTLVEQYGMHGIPVVIHSISRKENDLSSALNDIQKCCALLTTKKVAK